MGKTTIKSNGWKYGGSLNSTDSSWHDLPTEFSEILVEISQDLGGGDSRNFTIVIPKAEMSTDGTKPFYVGQYYSTSNYSGAVVNIKNATQWAYGGSKQNGVDRGTQYTLYYK